MRFKCLIFLCIWFFYLEASAQLALHVFAPSVTGSKAVVKLEMKNNFTQSVRSARATAFLLDAKGQVIGQSTKWVIGGEKGKTGLDVGKNGSYNFVISDRGLTAATNLLAKVIFNRIVLSDGKLADPAKLVNIVQTPK